MATKTEVTDANALRVLGEVADHHLALADRLDDIESALKDIASGFILLNKHIQEVGDNTKAQLARTSREIVEALKYAIVNGQPMPVPMPQYFPNTGTKPMYGGPSPDRFRGIELTAENAKHLMQSARSQEEMEEILRAIRPN